MPSWADIARSPLDPNDIPVSPPTSVYSLSSVESPSERAASPAPTTTSSTASLPNKSAEPDPTLSQLPDEEYLDILNYILESLKRIGFDILQRHDPEWLASHKYEKAKFMEWHKACRQLPYHCPGLGECLKEWLTDIRHAAYHYNKMTAICAVKTVYQASIFAEKMGPREEAKKFAWVAGELETCRKEIEKEGKVVGDRFTYPKAEETKMAERMQTILDKARRGDIGAIGEISAEVLQYTYERKTSENPWSDTKAWAENKGRMASSTSSQAPPSRASTATTWRCKTTDTKPVTTTSTKYIPPGKRGRRT